MSQTATDYMVPGRTRSFTHEQVAEINKVLAPLISDCVEQISANVPRIRAMDNRPRQIYTEEQPNVFMPYVAQGMLEDLIAELQALV